MIFYIFRVGSIELRESLVPSSEPHIEKNFLISWERKIFSGIFLYYRIFWNTMWDDYDIVS
jgi:hypothetical protein